TCPAMNRNSDALTRVICEYAPSGLPMASGLWIVIAGMVLDTFHALGMTGSSRCDGCAGSWKIRCRTVLLLQIWYGMYSTLVALPTPVARSRLVISTQMR